VHQAPRASAWKRTRQLVGRSWGSVCPHTMARSADSVAVRATKGITQGRCDGKRSSHSPKSKRGWTAVPLR
jgi:hypothetical protein